MAKKKSPIEQRIAEKVKNKIEQGLPLRDVSEYVALVMMQFKHRREDILERVRDINPLIAEKSRISYGSIVKRVSAKKAAESERINKIHNEQKKAESERTEDLKQQYLSAKSSGTEIRWGVTLKPDDRKSFFTASEVKEIVALRREKLSTYKARELLGCSLSEINRWDDEGLLPHAFKQVIQAGGKATEARFWLKSEVLSKKDQVEDWRASHDLKKSFKRKKSPLTKVVG